MNGLDVFGIPVVRFYLFSYPLDVHGNCCCITVLVPPHILVDSIRFQGFSGRTGEIIKYLELLQGEGDPDLSFP